MDDLEERLRSHARAFDGLVSLRSHDEDVSELKKKKKASKDEKKAKQSKTNPESADQQDQPKERKRKRTSGADDSETANANGIDQDDTHRERKSKKAMLDHVPEPESTAAEVDPKDTVKPQVDDAKLSKAQKKLDKERKKEEKRKRRDERKQAKLPQKATGAQKVDAAEQKADDDDKSGEWEDMPAEGAQDNDIEAVDVSGLEERQDARHSSASASPAPESLFSNNSGQPTTSSNTSIDVPASDPDKANKFTMPKIDQEILKERLRQRIEALRAARKADGPDGRPARNRQELLEARRKKEEQRKQHKKELRKQAREDEQRLKAEQELAQLRGSGSPMSLDLFSSPRPMSPDTNFAFGRVAFEDGQQLDSTLSNFFDARRKKGPSDPKTALQAAEAKRKRISGLDEAKRADIAEKDIWLNAKKRAHGERVRDDTDLLKKTLKRKEKMKSKSEKEWDARARTVEKAKEAKQRKREENLQKRREEKGVRGKKAKARLAQERAKREVAKKKAVRRPGFEGSFRTKARK